MADDEESLKGLIGREEEKQAEKKRKKKRTVGDIISLLALILALTVMAFAGYKVVTIFHEYWAGQATYSDIKDTAVTERDPDEEEVRRMEAVDGEEEEKVWNPPIQVDFEQLKEINSDVVGWLYMEALPDIINYPIVQGADNDFYLHRTYKKEDIFAGSIFIDYQNSGDFSDQNTIVYGHNMKDGSMFGNLRQYQQPETVDRSPYFWILTPDNVYKYQIFSIHSAPVNGDTYTLIQGPGSESKEYMEEMAAETEIGIGSFEFTETDKCVTLSTCTGDTTVRLVVQGVRIYPE